MASIDNPQDYSELREEVGVGHAGCWARIAWSQEPQNLVQVANASHLWQHHFWRSTMAMFERYRPMKMWSFVHEVGDDNVPTPYEHTHIVVWFKTRIDCCNACAFDVKRPALFGTVGRPDIQLVAGLVYGAQRL